MENASTENASTIRKSGKRKYGKHKYEFAGLEYASTENVSTPVIVEYALTLPNYKQFSKLFHSQNQEKICNMGLIVSLKISPHLTCVATLPCEMSVY